MHLLKLPQTNPNDTEAVILKWELPDGSQVRQGQTVCTVETAKSVYEIESSAAGFLRIVKPEGTTVAVGETMAAVADRPDQDVSDAIAPIAAGKPEPGVRTAGQRQATAKARLLAARHSIELDSLLGEGPVTEEEVAKVAGARGVTERAAGMGAGSGTLSEMHPSVQANVVAGVKRLLLVGGGNGALMALDIVSRLPGFLAVGVLDDRPDFAGKHITWVPALGPVGMAKRLWEERRFDEALITISTSITARMRIYDELAEAGILFANVIDPSNVIGMGGSMGIGNIIMGMSRIGPMAVVGNNNFFSAMTNIEHHCRIGSHNSFGPGIFLSGRVQIGDRVRFGAGIAVEPGMKIGDDAVVASGLAVTQDVTANHVMKGHRGLLRTKSTDV